MRTRPLTFVSGWRAWAPTFMRNASRPILSENPVETTVVVDDPYGFRFDPPSHGRLGMTSSGWSVCGPLKDIPIETRLLQRWPSLKLASPK